MAAAADAHRDWSKPSLAERRSRVTAAVDAQADARDDLALLLAWEIGKPWRLACADVDRALDGVRWYFEEIEPATGRNRAADLRVAQPMLGTDVDGAPYDRRQLSGPVSNIASSTALVASIACDDAQLARELAEHSAGAARQGRARSSAVPISCRP